MKKRKDHHHHQYCYHTTQHKKTNQLTCSRQQVRWGAKWRANPDHPWGSTLTFQRKAGVSCGTGLRHGVTMHPRGRHLREGMILLPHGMTHRMARKQQPTTQHYHYNTTTTTGGEHGVEKLIEKMVKDRIINAKMLVRNGVTEN